MKLIYDVFNRTIAPRIYLAKPGRRLLGQLNGIDESTATCTLHLNNCATLEFTVNKVVDGEESSFYNLIGQHYEFYLEQIGWFKINEEPQISYDGEVETTEVSAESLEIELQQYDQVGFRVNCATDDSVEMMAPDNIYTTLDGYKLPRDSVYFYRDLSQYEAAVQQYSQLDQTYGNLAAVVNTYPAVLSSPRLSKTGNALSVDLSKDLDGTGAYYSYMDVLTRELQRQQQLSLLWQVLNGTGWTVGYVDSSVSEDSPIPLYRQIGKFEIESNNKYSFLTQAVSNYFQCIFIFDTIHQKVNAYKTEGLGNDTSIFLSFHNIQNSIVKSGDRRIYTVFRVSNGDDLSIREVNFGEDTIEDISYFLTTEHFSQEFIDKYNAWQSYRESRRQEYMDLSVQYRDQNDVVSEIYLRVPVDIADTRQYSTMTNDELVNDKNNVLAQIAGYEALYVDEEGNFDIDALMASSDWPTYKMLKNIVVPNIDIELSNRTLPSKDDYVDFLDGYLYDFDTYGDSYGLKELHVQEKTLQDRVDRLVENGYNIPGDPADEYHTRNYNNYVKYSNAHASCLRAIAQRQTEYDNANDDLAAIDQRRQAINAEILPTHARFNFTDAEIALWNIYDIYTDYLNDNIVTTSISTNQEIIDQQYKLYKNAMDQLYADAHPQWTYSSTYDNLLALPEFNDWHGELDVGNFVRVAVRDNYQVKLRISAITFNPFLIDTEIGIEFTTMVNYKAKRNDFASLLSDTFSAAKNQIQATLYARSQDNYTYQIDSNLIRQLMNNVTFSEYLGDTIQGGIIQGGGVIIDLVDGKVTAKDIDVENITGTTGHFEEFFTRYLESDLVVTKTLEAGTAKITDLQTALVTSEKVVTEILEADTASINSLQSQLVTSDRVIAGVMSANSADITQLSSKLITSDVVVSTILSASDAQIGQLQAKLVTAQEIDVDTLKATLAQIDTLESDSAFVRYLQSVSSTSAKSVINDAYIYNAVAGKISVADLAAGNIVLTDTMNIISEDGGMVMNGKALQIYGEDSEGNPYVGIQLGYDAQSNPSLIVRNEDGAIIINPNGITENAISDNLIHNRMIDDATIQKTKLAFEILEPNEYGGIDLTKIYDGSGNSFGVEFDSFRQNTVDALDDINSKKMYRVEIVSNNGSIFKNGDVNCVLSCKVYSWDTEITDDINAANFTWRRQSRDTAGDIQWNANHSGGTKSITLVSSDVYGRSVFYCDVTLPDGSSVTAS